MNRTELIIKLILDKHNIEIGDENERIVKREDGSYNIEWWNPARCGFWKPLYENQSFDDVLEYLEDFVKEELDDAAGAW